MALLCLYMPHNATLRAGQRKREQGEAGQGGRERGGRGGNLKRRAPGKRRNAGKSEIRNRKGVSNVFDLGFLVHFHHPLVLSFVIPNPNHL